MRSNVAHQSRPAAPPDLAAWNRTLNRTHTMAAFRARSGGIVRWIEARRRRLVAERVVRGPHRRVVDVGCEDGWLAAGYAREVEALTLVDVDPGVLEEAHSSLPRARLVVADATDGDALARGLAFGHADVIVLSALLEHLPDPERAFAALTPFLRPKGRFVVYVPADAPILLAKHVLRTGRLGGLVRGLSLDPAPGHLRRFDRRSLARLLARQGRVREVAFDPAVLGYAGVVTPRSRLSRAR